MALYMTQKMSSAKTIPINYYRKQSTEHVSHDESGRFTEAAQANFAKFNNIGVANVEVGRFYSSQGVPTGGKTHEI